MLFLDGRFLKGRFRGVLLSTTAKDDNQGLYPLSFAVVDLETQESWHWFLIELRKVIPVDRRINFVSDWNPGLVNALPKVFFNDSHFFCLFHPSKNLRVKFRGSVFDNKFREQMIYLFEECAKIPSQMEFHWKLVELKKRGGRIMDTFLLVFAF
ncbi:hypothetical protein Droror1_Dr00008842 [Drosera rotundifolia]